MPPQFALDPAILDWLLEAGNPALRAGALSRLLDRPADDPELTAARAAINTTPPVSTILEAMEPGGHWRAEKSFYTGKYASTVWTLLVLAELGADGRDPRIQAACDFILSHSQHRDSGGFSMAGTAPNGGRASGVIPCLTGNMLWALVRFGRGGDPRVRAGIDWVTRIQRFDDGDGAPQGWPYDGFEMCWGRHTCHMGVVKTLKALAEIPQAERSAPMRETIGKAVEFLLIHHIFKRSHDLAKVSKPGWKKFGFPLMYQTDALEILNLLLDLGVDDSRMAEAVALVRGKQGEDGRWRMENTYSTLVAIEEKGAPSKWITLHALHALKRAHGLGRMAA
ncbi:hypothetical protein [Sinisalibacter aestuarii]|uniref:Nitrogen fixation protein NifH n=1 Tax=Sinisalibacter aestuarii TaxID=2949426 RepID=A0ABQ5LU22_9RHOB|nr:hypothetical protein [Sinisalibacter aestuarii]GKY88487.1 hypothetical protein STA1M1_23560 [Sinisalibacter aestuarii]